MAKAIDSSIRVCSDAESLRQRASGSIVGVVYFDFWTAQFPGEGWMDFPVVL